MSDSPINPDWIVDLARRAGEIAISFFGKTTGALKSDHSWVTEADLTVEKFLRAEIGSKRPKDAIIGEEGEKKIDADADFVWALDPIDGTRVFNHGMPIWGVSIGVIREGRPCLGVFILPILKDIYHTDGTTAYLNGKPLPVPDPIIDENAVFLVSEGAYKERAVNYPGKVISMGSAAAHLCYVARGSAVGAMDKAGIWDYAAGAAILGVQGIKCRYVSGEEVDFTALYDGQAVSTPTLLAPDRCFEELSKAALAG